MLLQSLSGGVPQTNSVPAGGIDYFLINVPTNADFATNLLLSATGPLNLLFNQTMLPTGTNAGDYTLLAGVTNGLSILSTTSVPTNIVPGGTYWLGVQNTNSFAVTFSLEVNFHLPPARESFQSPASRSRTWAGRTVSCSPGLRRPTTSFRCYGRTPCRRRTGNSSPILFITPVRSRPRTACSPSLTTVRKRRPVCRRCVFTGSCSRLESVHAYQRRVHQQHHFDQYPGTNSLWLTWSAPTNYLFEMQWTTNLMPVVTWHTSPNIMAYSTFVSPTNSLFNFFDDGSQGGLGPIKFYRLILLP